jgi:HK97 gp10 family phage protein
MPRVTDNGHVARLERMASRPLVDAIGNALLHGAGLIAESARHSIKDGAISGAGHVPSAPGQPPNADTHDLDQSIHVGELIETTAGVQTAVIADSDHARYLENGTSRIAPRPFLAPATELHRRDVREGIVRAVNGVTRGR